MNQTPKRRPRPRHPDADLIEKLGDSAALAERLGLTLACVSNWKSRGIPALLRYQRQDVFGPPDQLDSAA